MTTGRALSQLLRLAMPFAILLAAGAGGAACNSPVAEANPDASAAAPDATVPSDAAAPEEAEAAAGPALSTRRLPRRGAPMSAFRTMVTLRATETRTPGRLPLRSSVRRAARWSHPLGATLKIPAAALSTPTLITLNADCGPHECGEHWSSAFEIDPPGLAFAMPALLTLPYDPSDVPDGSATSSLAIEQSTDTGVTYTALSSTPDLVAHTITAATVESGQFASVLVSSGALFVTTSSPLASGLVGTPYSVTFAATGGDRAVMALVDRQPRDVPLRWGSH